jgi:putative phosphoesterase
MRLGLLSDIHGNKVALEAVLADMPTVDAAVCAGDIVGYNPQHRACLERVREQSITTIQGNHDRAVAGQGAFGFNSLAGAGVQHAQETLTDEQTAWLGQLPASRRVADGRVRLVHGHPADPDRYTYPRQFSADLLGDESVLVLGHTHVQGHERFDDGVVVNPGSVGQPRDDDPRAAYAVVDLETLAVTEHRVAYDIERVQRAIADAGLPDRLGTRLEEGR